MTKDEFLLYIIRTLILEYRLSFDTIDQLFNVDSRSIYNDIINVDNFSIARALDYILNYETIGSLIDQEKAKKEAGKFLLKFKYCKSPKEKSKMLNDLNNNLQIENLRNKKTDDMTIEEKNDIIKYRYKYCLTTVYTCNLFNISRKALRTWENDLEDELFSQRLKSLNDFNKSFHETNPKIR